MTIQELTAVVPPPSKPKYAGNERATRKYEANIGTALPPDYWQMVNTYGSGTFCGTFLMLISPFHPGYPQFLADAEERLGIFASRIPFPSFTPGNQGLIPWGTDENGNEMYWHAVGKPQKWPILLVSHDLRYESVPLSITTFLARAFTNRFRPNTMWAEPFDKEGLVFAPHRNCRSGRPPMASPVGASESNGRRRR